MVTVVGKTAEGLGVYRGLSTDLPLVPAPKNGSRFFAMDNGKTYWYDADSDTWEGYAGGGGGGGASELSDLSDVDLEGLADGDFLKYDEDLNKWVPAAGGGGVDPEKTLATIEGATASRAYDTGEWFIDANGYSSIAIAPVANGETWTLNTNYQRKVITQALFKPVNVRSSVPCATTLSDTGVSITIPANKYFSVCAKAQYDNSEPLSIAIAATANPSSPRDWIVPEVASSLASFSGRVSYNLTLYVFAKYSTAANNVVYINGIVEQ